MNESAIFFITYSFQLLFLQTKVHKRLEINKLKFNLKLIKLISSYILIFYLKKIGGKKLLAYPNIKHPEYSASYNIIFGKFDFSQ